MPTYELKNYKSSAHLSEETVAFTATIYRDGKKVGTCSNHGTGGPNEAYLSRKEQAILDAHLSTLDPVPCEWDEGGIRVDEDFFFAMLVDGMEKRKWEKRACRGKTVFRLIDDPDGQYRSYPMPFCERVKSILITRHGSKVAEILTETIKKAVTS